MTLEHDSKSEENGNLRSAKAAHSRQEGRFTQPWQPARLIGWNSVWVGQCDISAMRYLPPHDKAAQFGWPTESACFGITVLSSHPIAAALLWHVYAREGLCHIAADLMQIWENCRRYNNDGHVVRIAGKHMSQC